MFEIRSKGREFDRRLERLGRYDRSLAMELVHLMYEELQVNGCVPSMYRPHVLDNPSGRYNGCMEFHLADDVWSYIGRPNRINSYACWTYAPMRS